jgi:hypothetical protein
VRVLGDARRASALPASAMTIATTQMAVKIQPITA